jgi:hypothetical protein
MDQTRVLLAVDAANVYATLEPGARLNYGALLDFARQFGEIATTAAYVPRNNGIERERSFLMALKHQGFSRVVCRVVRQRPDGACKSDLS